jgi:hypothetical protein
LTTAAELKQHLVIPNTVTITGPATGNTLFVGVSEGKTITINSGGTLALGLNIEEIGAPVTNEGTITTATIKSTVLAGIFSKMGGKGAVTASSDTLALTEAFEIPADTVLTVSGDTNLGGVFELTVTGKLIYTGNGTGGLKPGGNVTITGSVVSAKDITITGTGTKTLDITSAAIKASSGVGLLKQEAGAFIKIDGLSGYAIDNAGIALDDFADAVAAIYDTIDALTNPTVTPDTPYMRPGVPSDVKVVGVIALTGATASGAPITTKPNGISGGSDDLVVFANTTVATTGYTVVGDFTGTTEFSLTSSGPDYQLKLVDTGNTGVADKWGVITFTGFTVENSGLTSPANSSSVLVAVKSQRAL